MDLDFNYMTDEELDELIIQIQEARKAREESRKTDLWRNVQRAVQNYIMECGMIELFTEDYNSRWTLILSKFPARLTFWIE